MRTARDAALVLPLAACGGGRRRAGGGDELEVTVWPGGRDGAVDEPQVTCPGDERCDRLARAAGTAFDAGARPASAAPRSTAAPEVAEVRGTIDGRSDRRDLQARGRLRDQPLEPGHLPARAVIEVRPLADAEVEAVAGRLPLHRLGAPGGEYLVAWEDGVPRRARARRVASTSRPSSRTCSSRRRCGGGGSRPELSRAFEALARERGHRLVGLEVAEDNAGAIELYERLGYVRTGDPPRRVVGTRAAADGAARGRRHAAPLREAARHRLASPPVATLLFVGGGRHQRRAILRVQGARPSRRRGRPEPGRAGACGRGRRRGRRLRGRRRRGRGRAPPRGRRRADVRDRPRRADRRGSRGGARAARDRLRDRAR